MPAHPFKVSQLMLFLGSVALSAMPASAGTFRPAPFILPPAHAMSASHLTTPRLSRQVQPLALHVLDSQISRGAVRLNATGTGSMRTLPGRIALKNPGSHGGGMPNVTGAAKTIFGGGAAQHGPGQKVPGFDGTHGGVNGLNLPGGQRQKGVPGVPGFDTSNGGVSVNLPGSADKHRQSDAAGDIAKSASAEAQDFVDQAGSGGINGINTPQHVGAGVSASDDDTVAQAAGAAAGNGADATKAAKPDGGSKLGREGGLGTGVVNGSGGVWTNPQGERIWTYTWADRDGTVHQIRTQLSGPGSSKKMPGDDSTSPVDSSSSLALNNPFTARANGGGTDNNAEGAQGPTGDLAPGSAMNRKNYGDGGGDAGENNGIDRSGALAANSSVARKDQGDGGSADSRGGGGGANPVSAGARVVNRGGGHHQVSARAVMLR